MQTIKTIFTGIFLLLIFFSQSAWAENNPDRCNDRIMKTVGKHFNVDLFSESERMNHYGELVEGVCKQSPQNQQWIISAFAYGEGFDDTVKLLLLSVVDVSRNRIIASYKGEVEKFGLRRDSLRIDTGRYNLSKTTRAFGVRLVGTNVDSCGHEGGYDHVMTLFVMEGKALKPVLSQVMKRWYIFGDRCGRAEEITQVDIDVSISVEPTSTKGFADLRLVARSDNKKSVSAIVKYNGKNYDMTLWEEAFYSVDWW